MSIKKSKLEIKTNYGKEELHLDPKELKGSNDVWDLIEILYRIIAR